MSLTPLELAEYCLEQARRDLDGCKQAAALMPFRAGDRVKHAPSGETWVLACDQRNNDVLPAGWPETLGKATHCRLVEAATDVERIKMLRAVAAARGAADEICRRGNLARHQLAQLRDAAVAQHQGQYFGTERHGEIDDFAVPETERNT